jgi:hypothetical protein
MPATPYLGNHTGVEVDDGVDKARAAFPLWSITGLTGGGLGDLDGVDVTGIATGTTVKVVVAGVLSIYQLQETTDVESAPDLIIPDVPPSGDARGWVLIPSPGAGTVTSVALSMPAGFSVAGSPVTGAGGFAVTEDTQAANLVKAGPPSGGAALPAYRALVLADLPAAVIGGLNYLGVWNATTNSPALASGVGAKGSYYKVSVAGTTTIDGVSEWNVGDWIAFNGTIWDKVDNTEEDATAVLKGRIQLAGDLAGTAALPVVTQASTSFALPGVISPAQITSNQNDYSPTGLSAAAVLRLSSDASRDITGLAGGAAGRILVLINIGGFNIRLRHLNGSSAAGNQFKIGYDLTVLPDQGVIIQYDATSTKWRLVQTKGIIKDDGLNVGIGTGATADAKVFIIGQSGTDQNAAIMKIYSAATKGIWIAYDTSTEIGALGAISEGVAHEPLKINPLGGTVYLGSSSSLVNVPGLTASQIVRTDASKNLVSALTYVPSVATKTPSATPVWDFDAAEEETMSVTAAITGMTTSNRGDGKEKTIILVSDGTLRNLAVNASWVPIGPAIAASLAAGKTAVLVLKCKGSGEANVLYAYSVQP